VRVEAASTVLLLASRVKIPAARVKIPVGLGGPSLRPMMWTFLAILVTFLLTRTVTRLIRSGSGVRAGLGNVRIGGHHVHHQVFGILIIIGTGIVLVSEMPPGTATPSACRLVAARRSGQDRMRALARVAAVEQVLAVVQHQQQPLAAQELRQRRQ
jgi:hypothetical protein